MRWRHGQDVGWFEGCWGPHFGSKQNSKVVIPSSDEPESNENAPEMDDKAGCMAAEVACGWAGAVIKKANHLLIKIL